jgi:ribosome-associated protein
MSENVLVISPDLSIPESELSFRFSTSSGPGGQHANRAATRVTVLFDIANSPSLSEAMRRLLLEQLEKRLDQNGVLAITVQESRSQHQNRQIALARLQRTLADALYEPPERRETTPGPEAIEQRLDEKRKQSRKKQARGRKWEPD